MKNNPLPPNPDELPGELLLEVTRNVFAAAALQGLIANKGNIGDGTSDLAFDQADSMMRRSRLPILIETMKGKKP